MVSPIGTSFSNRWFLAQFFVAIAGGLIWNILGLAILIERHTYLRTTEWWSIILMACLIVFAAILGWIWAIFTYRKPEAGYDNPKQLSLKVALWSGGGVFILGWVICIGVMLRLMNNEPWCLTGAIGSMLEDWLPYGLKITTLTILLSLLSNQWFLLSDQEKSDRPETAL